MLVVSSQRRVFAALGMSLPFLSLQMIAIGLTVEDISFVYGLLPVLSIGGIAAVGKKHEIDHYSLDL